jgi:hypothetical protein
MSIMLRVLHVLARTCYAQRLSSPHKATPCAWVGSTTSYGKAAIVFAGVVDVVVVNNSFARNGVPEIVRLFKKHRRTLQVTVLP